MTHPRTTRRTLIGAFVLLALVLPSMAAAGALSLGTARGVRGGAVSLDGGRSWLGLGPAPLPVLDGAELRTTSGGAFVDLTGGSLLRVLAFSAVRVHEAGGVTEIALRYGRLVFHLPPAARLAILTPAARLEAEPDRPAAGEVFVGADGTMGVRLREGRARVEDPFGARPTMLASLQPVFLPRRPTDPGPLFTSEGVTAPAPGARAVFSPGGESLGYIQPDGQLVVHPGYTADLTGPFPRRLVDAALARVPDPRRDAAYPLFDVVGGYVGHLAGPVFYAQAVGAATPPRPVEAVVVRPPAEVVARGQAAAQPLTRGARLAEGDRVRTGRGGAAELRLADGSLIRLSELSDFEIERLEVDAAGAPRSSRFQLTAGKVRAWVVRQMVAKIAAIQGDFTIRTPVMVAAVRQTDLAVLQQPRGVGHSYTFAGAVENTGTAGGSVTCRADTFTEVSPGGGPTPCRPIPPLDRRALQQELVFETLSDEPGIPAGWYFAGGAFFVTGGLGGAGASGVFGGGGRGTAEATSLRPLR